MTPNYNDGNWHGWNGGECPVHPQSVVEYLWHDTNQNRFGSAQRMAGYDENDERPAWPHVIRFRVITPYVEPAPETPTKPAKRDLRTIDEPFGELDERTQKRLRKAAKRGWPVQWFDGLSWEEDNPSFNSGFAYRLDPAFTPPAKPEPAPKVEIITQDMWQGGDGRLFNSGIGRGPTNQITITFTRANGEIDNDSYKVEVKG